MFPRVPQSIQIASPFDLSAKR